ncbi:cholinergic receptor, nicotinic, beta 1 (muscle) like isoform X3 [Onychostoma macrolepis]|uniref:cholinergic receptor, nicotinic, beta 1 (muscle) like isoform X3 n=1 Tax=Onychostoma macrolepis TaxID=369639 RepID=UPI00272B6474|nr:cholinergic receptor, nicotinic, beta 1 (muscle) like isoform X3 [Onychostoma macrolepis]
MKTLLGVLWCCWLLTLTVASKAERMLLEDLFQDYNLKVRPARTWNEQVMVRVGMTLVQLISLNEKNEEMTTNVFMNMEWTDYRLSWNPEDYDNIDVVRIPPLKVWRPDIYLINNNDGQFDVALYVNVLVRSDGTVSWYPPAIYRSSCSIEVAYFPFDWQNCTMVFRSYTYDSSEVDLQYSLDEDGNELHEIVIDENAFTGEKMTLSISVLIALTVFMLLLADKVPETSLGIPIIVNYVMFTMILVTFSVILSVVVLNLHHRTPSTHHMPLWVRKVFINLLPRYLGVLRPQTEEPVEDEPKENIPLGCLDKGLKPGGEYFIRKINPELVLPWRGSHNENTVKLQRFSNSDNYCLILPPNLKSAIAAITYMAEQLKKQDVDDTMTDDWQYIAVVLDRLFFWLFVIITTLGTLAMFLDASFNYTPDQPFP